MTTQEQETKILELGGRRFLSLIDKLITEGCTFPIGEREILKWRNVGKVTVRRLRALGWIIPYEESDIDALPVRAACALINLGIETKSEALRLIQEGCLKGNNPRFWPRNCGFKTINQIRKWCGLVELKHKKSTYFCPHCHKEICLSELLKR